MWEKERIGGRAGGGGGEDSIGYSIYCKRVGAIRFAREHFFILKNDC